MLVIDEKILKGDAEMFEDWIVIRVMIKNVSNGIKNPIDLQSVRECEITLEDDLKML